MNSVKGYMTAVRENIYFLNKLWRSCINDPVKFVKNYCAVKSNRKTRFIQLLLPLLLVLQKANAQYKPLRLLSADRD